MYPVLQKKAFSNLVKCLVVEAPLVARKARPGQFVIVRFDEKGERIPMTIADFDAQAGTITLVVQEVGKSTSQMGLMEAGDAFQNVAGPLGCPSDIRRYGTVVVVGGGVGIAPVFPITRALQQAGNRVISIIGARSKNLLFWQERMAQYSDQVIVCTDDGSTGRKAVVTEPLQELLQAGSVIDQVWAVGPAVMMKYVAETTRLANVPTIASLNSIMIDGTGMCGGCRVVLKDGARFVCVDGPEFDAHLVDWDNLLARLSFYRAEEKAAMERWQEHRCRLEAQIAAAQAEVEAESIVAEPSHG